METLYRKVGRKYVPHSIQWHDDTSQMKIGTCRLTYAYGPAARMFHYDVTPDTAGFHAAGMIFRKAIEDAVREKSIPSPSDGEVKKYTKKQIEIIKRFRHEMAEAGGMLPTWWNHASSWDIAEAGFDALKKRLDGDHLPPELDR